MSLAPQRLTAAVTIAVPAALRCIVVIAGNIRRHPIAPAEPLDAVRGF